MHFGVAGNIISIEKSVSKREGRNQAVSGAQLYFSTKKVKTASLGEPSPLPDLSGEHILQNDLIFCLDEDDEIYEGYGRCKNAYPYRQYNNYTNDLEEKEVKTAVLENEHVRAVFLPEFGGRLWELWDKRREENILYTNDVLKFHNLAVRNAWFSGGVEWNIGVIGHTPLTTEQMYAARLPTTAEILCSGCMSTRGSVKWHTRWISGWMGTGSAAGYGS